MTLLEMVIATSLLAVLMTSISVVMRTGRQAWDAHEADYTRIEAGHATLRHIVRKLRAADSVAALSAPNDNSGSISLNMPGNIVETWDHDAPTNTINFRSGLTGAFSSLAPNITGLTISGFRANGTTPTTVPAEAKMLRIDITFAVPSGTRTLRSWAWIRSW